jgi:hypothetical protein
MERVQRVLDRIPQNVSWADDDGNELPELPQFLKEYGNPPIKSKTDLTKEERFERGEEGLIDTIVKDADDDGEPQPPTREEQAYKDVSLSFAMKEETLDDDVVELLHHINNKTGAPTMQARAALLKLASSGLSGSSAKNSIKRGRQVTKLQVEVEEAKHQKDANQRLLESLADEMKSNNKLLYAIARELNEIREGGDADSFRKVPTLRDGRARLEVSNKQLRARFEDAVGRRNHFGDKLVTLSEELKDATAVSDDLLTYEDAALLQMTAGTSIGNVPPGDDDYVSTNWPPVRDALMSLFSVSEVRSPVIIVSERKLNDRDIVRPIRDREVSTINAIEKHFKLDMPSSILPLAISGDASGAYNMTMSFDLVKGNHHPDRERDLVKELEDSNLISYAGYDPELWTRGFGVPLSQIGKRIVRVWKSKGLMPLTTPDLISEFDPAFAYRKNEATQQRDQRSVFGVPLQYKSEPVRKGKDDAEASVDLEENPLEDLDDEEFD